MAPLITGQAQLDMKRYGRLLAALLLVALAGCGSGGAATPTAAKTTDEPTSADARPTPTPAVSGTLAYALDGDIYVADPDGSNAVKIADGRSDEDCDSAGEYWTEGPMWSPDGRYLAYRQRDCSTPESLGNGQISDAEGNVLATFPTGTGWQIAWSPDSTRIAVWDSFAETIGVYGLDGARQTRLTMPPGWQPSGDHDPVWMPDGTSLRVENVGVPLDGGTPGQLPLPYGAAYSPDGSHVAYHDHRSLVVAEADGSNPQRHGLDIGQEEVKRVALFPLWSPTGDRIAFVSFVSSDAQLRVLDVATGTTVTLLVESSDYLSLIDFSPEGDRILFSRTNESGAGRSALWSINADGSDLRRLISGTAWGDWLSPSQIG